MYRDRDFHLQRDVAWNAGALTQDLELTTLCNGMALGDQFLYEVAKSAVLSGVKTDRHTILYRQDILKDCLKNPAIVREIYGIAVAAIEGEKKHWSFFAKYPTGILHRAIEVLQMFVGMLKQLRRIADEHAERFRSEGFRRFFEMLQRELGDEYFARIEAHLRELKFREGVLLTPV